MAKKSRKKIDPIVLKPGLAGTRFYRVSNVVVQKNKNFVGMIAICMIIAGVFYPYPGIAMWIGFAFAGYSAVANDSIQTIGTFLASNEDKKWYHLWLYIGTIFLVTVFASWYLYNGDVSFQRLASKGFSEAPKSFVFLQLAAPIILMILTRLRMPVSTTFLLLSAFSASTSGILKVTQKSLTGYVIAFFVSIIVYLIFANGIKKLLKGKAHRSWTWAQWVISGGLWSVWIMQDAANIAVFLPRQLNIWEFVTFAGYIFFGLGLLFYLKGDKIQRIVKSKTEITDVRSATLVDLTYMIILIFFQNLSNIPMSTTWVFIGLLGGREIGMKLSKSFNSKLSLKKTIKLVGIDIAYATIGLTISISLALAINPVIRDEVFAFFK